LDRIPFSEKDTWTRLFHSVNRDTKAGVVEATANTRERYWRHWLDFIPASIDPHLQNVDEQEKLMVLQAFARRTREGAFGRGKQVKTGSVQTAIGAIAKTVELAGNPNPLHKPGTTNYYAALAQQTETYKREDPATEKQLAVPVDVPNHVFLATRTGRNSKEKAIGELTLIAFYFLLRVGEYTYHGTGKRRTQQFRLGDIKFFTANTMVPLEQLKQHAQGITLVSMTIDNQKNGQRGQTLSHHAVNTDTACCPVQALVSRTIDMLAMGATADTLICAFKNVKSMAWQFVRSTDIVKAVQNSVYALGLTEKGGYTLKQVGSHSLRAGGVMALYLTKHSPMEIQRAGRWTSNTFMEYIHSQLDVSSKGLAQAMSTIIPFMNMAR